MDKLWELLKKAGVDAKEIEAAKAEVEAELEDQVSGLKKKNGELLGKLKARGQGDDEKVASLEAQVEELQAKTSGYEKQIKKLTDEKTKVEQTATERLAAEQRALNGLLVENGLVEGLAKLGVKKEHLPAVKALLAQKVGIDADGDARRAVVALKKDGKEEKLSLEDYLQKEWAASEEGKAFIPAQHNAGGGFKGTPGKGTGRIMSLTEFNNMNPKDRAAFFAEGGTLNDKE